MRSAYQLIGCFLLLCSLQVQATLISVEASADMTSGHFLSTTLLPIGTTVSANVQFDIGPGTISPSPIFSNITGSFSWIDSVLGFQTYSPTGAAIKTTHSAGWFSLLFTGVGNSINGVTPHSFSLVFDIGSNPFTPPANSSPLSELVLNGSVMGFRVGASSPQGTTGFGDLEGNVTGSISQVSLPNTCVLFGLGFFGLALRQRTKNK